MLPEKELWIAANMVLSQHQQGASQFVATRIVELETEGDLAGAMVWRAIRGKLDLLNSDAVLLNDLLH